MSVVMNNIIDDNNEKTSGFKIVAGPSFSKKFPSEVEWQDFLKNILDDKGKEFSNLWYSKALAAGGIPLRKDYSIEDMVKYGQNIFIAKREESNRWMVTYCGTDIVKNAGFETTGKYMDEFGNPETMDFWLQSIDILTVEKKPVLEYTTLAFVKKDFIHCLSINFPLRSADDKEPDMFFAFEVFGNKAYAPKYL
jgi:hypothetical protein